MKLSSFTALLGVAVVAFPTIAHAGFDLSTGFEFDDTSLDFTSGDSPNSVQFLKGEAKTADARG